MRARDRRCSTCSSRRPASAGACASALRPGAAAGLRRHSPSAAAHEQRLERALAVARHAAPPHRGASSVTGRASSSAAATSSAGTSRCAGQPRQRRECGWPSRSTAAGKQLLRFRTLAACSRAGLGSAFVFAVLAAGAAIDGPGSERPSRRHVALLVAGVDGPGLRGRDGRAGPGGRCTTPTSPSPALEPRSNGAVPAELSGSGAPGRRECRRTAPIRRARQSRARLHGAIGAPDADPFPRARDQHERARTEHQRARGLTV